MVKVMAVWPRYMYITRNQTPTHTQHTNGKKNGKWIKELPLMWCTKQRHYELAHLALFLELG